MHILPGSEATTMTGRFDEARRRGLAALVMVIFSISACNREKKPGKAAARSPAPAATAASVKQHAGGEVIAVRDRDSEPVLVKWMGDDNIIALARLLNVRVKAAADYELQRWGSDTTRALAEEMAREHAAIRYTIDSVAASLGMTPVLPALASEIDSATRRHLTMLEVAGGRPLDRAYVKEQIASHEYMIDYVTKFAAAAERQALRTAMDTISAKLKTHLASGRALQVEYAKADSLKAVRDSVRRERNRRP
jgi:predicted outer membrane protein